MFTVNTIMVLVNHYMCYVETPTIGYRLKPNYAYLLPECTGRPSQYALSALYLCDGIEGYDAARQQLLQFEESLDEKRYPGSH